MKSDTKRYCPDCEIPLDYYKCKFCKEKFVSQDDGELEIAAPY